MEKAENSKIEQPDEMPTYEEFIEAAKQDFMVSFGFSRENVDSYFSEEETMKSCSWKYKQFKADVEKSPEKLRYYGSRISSLNYCLWLEY